MEIKFNSKRIIIGMLILVPILTFSQNAPITTANSVSSCQNASFSVPVTVTNFTQITAVSLRLDYNPTLLSYAGYSNLNTSLAGCIVNSNTVSATLRKISIIWSDVYPLTLTNGSKLVDLNFTLISGSPTLSFNNVSNSGGDCEYADQNGDPLNDLPTSTYYTNALITNLNPVAAGTISGQANVFQGQSGLVYSVDAIQNATSYVWGIPDGFTGSSSTNSISLATSNTTLSGNISVKGHNICGDGLASTLYVNVYKHVILKLFLEGLFNKETQLMNQAQDENGNHFGNDISDKISIELHNSFSPFAFQFSATNLDLKTDGTCDFALPALNNGMYYLVIKHSNHLETWSNEPVQFSGLSVAYDFTTSADLAFGDNLKGLATGKYGLYAGDVNADGTINSQDILEIKTSAINFTKGYIATDVNGDGIVDALDLIIVDRNSAGFVSVKKP